MSKAIHNPQKVPLESLPANHRFLFKDERKKLASSKLLPQSDITRWQSSSKSWSKHSCWQGSDERFTYCVPITFKVDKRLTNHTYIIGSRGK